MSWWDELPEEACKWTRITEWPAEHRVTWAVGAWKKVVALGQEISMAAARKKIEAVKRGETDARN